ncbi:MAG: hypothetical protein JWQ79_1857 [Mucilaginibacter sp.]|nr:hypothetical protein [Mucilaginibacter sp.]
MKYIIYLLFVITCIKVNAQQTYSITGKVGDEKGTPLTEATVFIANTQKVTSTNKEGKFILEGLQPGVYDVAVKLLGYESTIHTVKLPNLGITINIALKETSIALNAVTINVHDLNRAKRLQLFLENFIGETVNAQQCKLLNPGAIGFHFDIKTNVLHASANDLLIVENKALGYKIKYLLTDFEYNYNNGFCVVGGAPYFEILNGSAVQQKKWEENRKVVYLSSARHFFRALVNNTLQREGFLVYMIAKVSTPVNRLKNNDEITVRYRAEADGASGYWMTYLKLKRPQKEYTGAAIRIKDDTVKWLTAFQLKETDTLFIKGDTVVKILTSKPKTIGSVIIPREDTIALRYLYIVYLGEKESPLFSKTGTPVELYPFLNSLLSKQQKRQRQVSTLQPMADTVKINSNGTLTPAKGFMHTGYWAWQRIADLTPLDYFVDPPEGKSNKP